MFHFHKVFLFLLLPFSVAEPGVEIIAHRGASYDAPENTVASFQLAWQQGADAGELDIWMTKDKKIVVLHDRDTKRVAGVDKKVSEQTLEELRRLDLGQKQWSKFAGEKIPTLAEMLATVPAGKRLFIEIKDPALSLEELDAILRQAGLKPRQTPIICFQASLLAAVKKRRPDLETYLIVSLTNQKEKSPTPAALIARVKEINADGLDLSLAPALDQAMVDAIKQAGLKVFVWTVNDPAAARRLKTLGVHGITTDRPGLLRAHLEK